MKQKNPIHLALLISLLLLTAGLIMTIDAYHKRLSVLTAYNQVKFLKLIPHRITEDETLKMPLYQENVIMEKNPVLSGTVSGGYYENKKSIRTLEVTVKRGPLAEIELHTLLDARSRN